MSDKSKKLPWMKWYWGAWRKDPGVRALDIEKERGVWFEILGLMFECEPRGFLLLNGKPYPLPALARELGLDEKKLTERLATFEQYGLFSIDSETGAIYNRRMVRDAKGGQEGGENGEKGGSEGEKGGNPHLTGGYDGPGYLFAYKRKSDGWIKIGLSKNPSKRIYRLQEESPQEQLIVIETFAVDSMSGAKAVITAYYYKQTKNGWIKLSPEESKDVFSPLRFPPGVPPKGTITQEVRSQKSERREEEEEQQTAAKIDPSELPKDWQPSDDLLTWAKTDVPKVDVAAATKLFRVHFHNPATKNRLRAHWDSEWKKWMLREAKGTPTDQPSPASPGEYLNKHTGRPAGEFVR